MIYTECLKNKSKEELFALGKKIVEEFADVNNLPMPLIKKIGFNDRFPDNRGCYFRGEIELCMDNCSDPVKGRTRTTVDIPMLQGRRHSVGSAGS